MRRALAALGLFASLMAGQFGSGMANSAGQTRRRLFFPPKPEAEE